MKVDVPIEWLACLEELIPKLKSMKDLEAKEKKRESKKKSNKKESDQQESEYYEKIMGNDSEHRPAIKLELEPSEKYRKKVFNPLIISWLAHFYVKEIVDEHYWRYRNSENKIYDKLEINRRTYDRWIYDEVHASGEYFFAIQTLLLNTELDCIGDIKLHDMLIRSFLFIVTKIKNDILCGYEGSVAGHDELLYEDHLAILSCLKIFNLMVKYPSRYYFPPKYKIEPHRELGAFPNSSKNPLPNSHAIALENCADLLRRQDWSTYSWLLRQGSDYLDNRELKYSWERYISAKIVLSWMNTWGDAVAIFANSYDLNWPRFEV